MDHAQPMTKVVGANYGNSVIRLNGTPPSFSKAKNFCYFSFALLDNESFPDRSLCL